MVSFIAISAGTFLLILIPRLLGLKWAEVAGIVFAVWAFGFTAFQIIKSNSSEENSSLKELREELINLVEDVKKNSAEKDKIHDKDLDFVKQQTAIMSLIVQEQHRINGEIFEIIRTTEKLSAAIAQNSEYTKLLKRLSNFERLLKNEKASSYQMLVYLLARFEKLEKGDQDP